MVAEGAARYLSSHVPFELRQSLIGTDVDSDARDWRNLCEIGVSRILFTPEEGGQGGTGGNIGAIFEALGAAVALEPFLGTLVAGKILASAGTHAPGLQGLVTGSLRIGVAYQEKGSLHDPESIKSCAARTESGWSLDGRKIAIPGGDSADFVIVSARCDTPGTPGVSLFLLPWVSVASGWAGQSAIDGSVVSTVSLDGIQLPRQALIGKAGQGLAHLRRGLMYGAFAVCAETIGLLSTASRFIQSYLAASRQFDTTIGSPQRGLRSQASIPVEADEAISAVTDAAAALDQDDPSAERAVSVAKASLASIAVNVAQQFTDMHEPIGLMRELPLAHVVHGLNLAGHLFGDADFHLRRSVELSTQRS